MDLLIYSLLALTSVVGLAFIVERGFALRWGRVVPPAVTEALAACRTRDDVGNVAPGSARRNRRRSVGCSRSPADHLDWPKADNTDALQTAARHEIVRLEPRPCRAGDQSSASRRCWAWSAPSRA